MRSRSGFWRVPQHYPGDGLGPSPGTGAGDIYPPGVFTCLGQQTTRIKVVAGDQRDEITLVAGDKDYVPVVEKVRRRGLTFHVVFWDHAARELREACSAFVSLNQYLDHLRIK